MKDGQERMKTLMDDNLEMKAHQEATRTDQVKMSAEMKTH
jgi:hypothetical protein